jgi:uncharacterized membrane protein YeaQ/YmgE (transglycosylase-associated protein family)
MIVNIVTWIIYGLIVGAVARWVVRGDQSDNWITAILLGIAGSFVGGFVGNLIFKNKEGGAGTGRIVEFLLSVGGAIVLVLLNKWFFHI